VTCCDWSKLDDGWTFDESTWLLRHGADWITLRELLPIIDQVNPSLFDGFKREAMRQINKCRIRDTERAPVDNEAELESIHQSFTAGYVRREATHGWRNPPSIYEEDKE
jgi:hypothetical protein